MSPTELPVLECSRLAEFSSPDPLFKLFPIELPALDDSNPETIGEGSLGVSAHPVFLDVEALKGVKHLWRSERLGLAGSIRWTLDRLLAELLGPETLTIKESADEEVRTEVLEM